MKRFAGILAIQFVVIFAAAFLGSWAFMHWRATSPASTMPSSEMSWFQSELGVNTAQAAKLAELDREFENQQSKLCEQHCAKRVELAGMIKNGDAMTPQMEALSRELCDLEAKSQRLTVEHIFAVGKQLNATQREKFAEKVYNQMCNSCPMGMHKPAMGKQASNSCGSEGCSCCVASNSHKSAPARPVAQAVPIQPRLDVSFAKIAIQFPEPQSTRVSHVVATALAVPPPSSLFLLFSSFLI